MVSCIYCLSAIEETNQQYVVNDMGPDIISLIEENFEVRNTDNGGVFCSQCFDNIIQIMSSAVSVTEEVHEHENHKGTIVCVRCQKSLLKKRTYAVTEGPINNFIAEEIAPREIPERALLCFSCWLYTQRALQQQQITFSSEVEANVCVCCFRSLTQKPTHALPEGPERDIITSKIHPREIPPGGLVCYACWMAARREVQRGTKSDEIQQNSGLSFMRHADTLCEWCMNLIHRKQFRKLPNGAIRDLIAARIYPRELPDYALLCSNCWKNAQAFLQEDENQLQHLQPSIEIDRFAHTTNSSASCFIPGCENIERNCVPKYMRKEIYKSKKLFVTKNARICNEHKMSIDWNFLDQRQFSHTFTKIELESMLKFTFQYL